MANLKLRRPENISGDIFVDNTCIDCDTCRWMSPKIFRRQGEKSAVYYQPTNQKERLEAMQALLSCPTNSIGTIETPKDIKNVHKTLPILVADNVYHCGYHSPKSFGAASYFIVRPEGNILVDSPQFLAPLVKRLEAMGGIKYMYLTHRDDVVDHQKFREHFSCDRILHIDDISPDTKDVEIKLTGTDSISLTPDLLIIPVTGHTKAHTVLLYQKFLFTGDHLAWSDPLNQLYAFRRYCWYSWSEQIISMGKLINYDFEWVLPGHGLRYHTDKKTMQQELKKCLVWMQKY